eukprot:scaffold28695_cov62-Phaeocystis_antarctica.AAC.2
MYPLHLPGPAPVTQVMPYCFCTSFERRLVTYGLLCTVSRKCAHVHRPPRQAHHVLPRATLGPPCRTVGRGSVIVVVDTRIGN